MTFFFDGIPAPPPTPPAPLGAGAGGGAGARMHGCSGGNDRGNY